MSARFAELMAISASQTRESDLATQQILAEKKRKEELRKKEKILEIQSEINLPQVRWGVANGMGVYSLFSVFFLLYIFFEGKF